MIEMNSISGLPPFIWLIVIGGIMLLIAFAGKIKIKNFLIIPDISLAGRVVLGVIGGILITLGIWLLLFGARLRPGMEVQTDKPIIEEPQPALEIIIDKPTGEIYSTDEHVKIIVEGRILALPSEMEKANVYILVRPLDSGGLWTQKSASPASDIWTVRAFLGGTGESSARDNEQFVITAVLTKEILASYYNNIKELPEKDTYKSTPVTLTVKR